MHATYHKLHVVLFWKGMWKDVKEYIRHYDVCQRYKYENMSSLGLLQPLPKPQGIFFPDITMDFIEGLPKSNGSSVIFVVVDRMIKYAHFMPFYHPYNAATVARAFLDNVYKLHDFPSSILSDRDVVFVRLQGVSLRASTVYRPQMDGQ